MKLFVWDYHGVIERGNEIAAWDVTNRVLNDFGYNERLSQEDAEQLYGRKWYEYFEYILPNEPHERHLELQQAGFEFTHNHPKQVATFIKPTPHIHAVLEEIAKKHEQILISNTDPESLILYLEMVSIESHFRKETAFAANGHQKDSANSKRDILKKYLEGKVFDDIVIIGDSPSDMELREVGGGKTYLYTHPGMKHRNCVSDYKITDLREILKEI